MSLKQEFQKKKKIAASLHLFTLGKMKSLGVIFGYDSWFIFFSKDRNPFGPPKLFRNGMLDYSLASSCTQLWNPLSWQKDHWNHMFSAVFPGSNT